MSSAYVHALDPFAIQFTETFGIRWYGLAYLSGFVFGYLMLHWLAKRKVILLSVEQVSDFVTFSAIGVLVGGRLGYCLFYSPGLFVQFGDEFPFWGVLEVHKGGMASHGGMLGVALACWIFSRKYKLPFSHLLDLTVLAASVGFFFGRIANFINGELYGRQAPPGLSWAVKFPQEMYGWVGGSVEKLKQLAPVAEALGPVQVSGQPVTATADKWISWVSDGGSLFRRYIEIYIEQMIQAVQSGNQKIIELLGPVLTSRYPSQLVQSLLEGLLVFIALMIIWKKPRRPGVISAWFGILYAIARIVGEQYRLPDAHIGFQWLGLTRGQWLSVGLLMIGLIYLAYAATRKVAPIGGWGSSKSVD